MKHSSERSAERVLEIATELLAVDTQNPPGETRQIAEWVGSFLEDLGITTRTVATNPAKPNVVATLPGGSDQTLLYNGHLDTVPFDADEWTYIRRSMRSNGTPPCSSPKSGTLLVSDACRPLSVRR